MRTRALRIGGRLDLYVTRLFLSSYATAFFVVVGLYFILDFTTFIDDYLEPMKDGTPKPTLLIVRYYLLSVPFLFLQVAPFVTLVASLFTVSKLLKFNETVAATRGGRVDAMNAPVVITSLGAFEVKAGAPIVVPPSVGTLFVGTAHRELISNKTKNESAEVITLSLTFDHRVVNGAGAAAFANEIKKQVEKFEIPSAKMSKTSTEKR